MSMTSNWNPIIEKFHKRLISWKAKTLSYGGRLTLPKSVLGALDGFSRQIAEITSSTFPSRENEEEFEEDPQEDPEEEMEEWDDMDIIEEEEEDPEEDPEEWDDVDIEQVMKYLIQSSPPRNLINPAVPKHSSPEQSSESEIMTLLIPMILRRASFQRAL
ncbi:hypothetical protein Tco_0771152 [Tanacetum coccineum]|uniref:Uncharacterized protein n=1 Tax=Tanacetum coccineum TaxID=301880 RepID=A0ABQ4ZGU4_9ASTR